MHYPSERRRPALIADNAMICFPSAYVRRMSFNGAFFIRPLLDEHTHACIGALASLRPPAPGCLPPTETGVVEKDD